MLLEVEISSLQQEIEKKTTAEPWTIKRILSDPNLKLPVFLVCMIQFGQQMSGINVVFYYSNSIFIDAGLGITGAQYATLGTGAANIGMALISVPVMSSLNRRGVLLSSIYLCLGCLIVLCTSILLIVSEVNWSMKARKHCKFKVQVCEIIGCIFTASIIAHACDMHDSRSGLCDILWNRPWTDTVLHWI